MENILIGELLSVANDIGLNRFLKNALLIETPSIIGHLDNNVASTVIRFEFEPTAPWLARPSSVVWHLHAVIHSIADHMNERIAEGFHKIAVDFRFTADGAELDFLLHVL